MTGQELGATILEAPERAADRAARHPDRRSPPSHLLVMVVRGTRPEAIKLAPVIRELAELEIVRAARPDLDGDGAAPVDFAYSPERVVPGKTLQEIVSNDRIIGGVGERAARRAAACYRTFVRGRCAVTDDRTAEMVKLAENTFRDVNIALASELSMVCDEQSLDAWEVIRTANSHPRVSILSPGPGAAGHCIPVDPWFLVAASPTTARLIRASREVNDASRGTSSASCDRWWRAAVPTRGWPASGCRTRPTPTTSGRARPLDRGTAGRGVSGKGGGGGSVRRGPGHAAPGAGIVLAFAGVALMSGGPAVGAHLWALPLPVLGYAGVALYQAYLKRIGTLSPNELNCWVSLQPCDLSEHAIVRRLRHSRSFATGADAEAS